MPVNISRRQNQLYYETNHYLNADTHDLKKAQRLVKGYKILGRKFTGILTAPRTIEIPKFEIHEYRKTPYYSTMATLEKFVRNELIHEVRNFIIHGSLATMDYVPGFSDLDTFVILKQEVFHSIDRLNKLRKKISQSKKLLKTIDPLAHHGFIFCHEENLNYYPQHYLPVAVFPYAKILLGSTRITFHLRDDQKEVLENFEHYYEIFQSITRTGIIKNKPGSETYQLKWFVSMLLLMPSLYLQAKGIFLYKKFSFDLVRHPFLKKISRARKDFSAARKILGKNRFQESLSMLKEWRRDLLNFQKRKFINHPRKISLDIYAKARQEIIRPLRKNSDVLSLYEYGSVSAPGVSDLDLIVVTRNKLVNAFRQPNGPNIEKVAKGALMVIPEAIFKKIQWFDQVNLNRLYGQTIPIERLDRKNVAQRSMAGVIDWLPERLIRIIALLHRDPLDVQYALRYLRSFSYSLENAAGLVDFGNYKKFMDELAYLRTHWSKDKAERLTSLVHRGIYLGYEALNAFTKKYFDHYKGSAGSIKLFPGQEIIFTKNERLVDPDWSIAQSKQGDTRVFISAKLAPHFRFYLNQPRKLAAAMRQQADFSGPIEKPEKRYAAFLKRKWGLAESAAAFLVNNNLKSGLYRFGFYFNNYLENHG